MSAPTFDHWPRAQAHRDDPIGDLARDYSQDLRDWRHEHGKRAPFAASPIALHHRLQELHACDGALESLQRAQDEWETAT